MPQNDCCVPFHEWSPVQKEWDRIPFVCHRHVEQEVDGLGRARRVYKLDSINSFISKHISQASNDLQSTSMDSAPTKVPAPTTESAPTTDSTPTTVPDHRGYPQWVTIFIKNGSLATLKLKNLNVSYGKLHANGE